MSRASELKRKYNITVEMYEEMRSAQDGRCYICRKKPRARDPELAVDHDHRTGLIRGLLCPRCNHDQLGRFSEDPMYYQRAHDYLAYPPARKLFGSRFVPDSVGNALGEDGVQ